MSTIKQKIAFREVLKGSTLTKAMKVAKYSPTTVTTTGKLTRTKGWQELMDKFIPDKDLIKVHKEGLRAGKKVFKNNNELVSEEPDYPTRHKYLETAYKLKKRIGDSNTDTTRPIIINIAREIAEQNGININASTSQNSDRQAPIQGGELWQENGENHRGD